MDRNDLIKALGNAFESPKEEPSTPSSHVESANVGEKDVLRLLTDYQSKGAMYDLHTKHPDVYMVDKLVNELASSGQSDIEIVGRELILKFNTAVENNDDDKISSIISECKDCCLRLQTIDRNSPEKMLAYLMVIERIKKM